MGLPMHRWLALFALAAFALFAHAGEPIRIGSVVSATGSASIIGDPQLKTLQMYVDSINRQGGVLGRQLELISYDDTSDVNKANSFTKRLLANDHVDVVIGGSMSGAAMSMIPLVEQAEVPFITMAGAISIVEPVKKWVFKTSLTDRIVAEMVFRNMRQRGITKIALLSENSGYGQSGKTQSEAVASRADRAGERLDFLVIQSARGFVEQQQPRFGGERARELHALADAERKLGRACMHHARQPEEFDLLRCAASRRAFLAGHPRQSQRTGEKAAAHAAVRAQQHVVEHAHRVEQRQVLEGAADAQRGDAVSRQRTEVQSVEAHAPGVRFVQARHAVEQRRLPGAVRTDQAAHRAALHGEGDAVECDDAAEAHADALDGEQRFFPAGRHRANPRIPAGGQATPMTYAVEDGRQLVVMVAGGHGSVGTKPGDYVIAYALPRD